MIPAVPWAFVAMSCATQGGTLWGPAGPTELRTAAYALGVRDGLPEMTVLLSNGELGCAGPVRGEAGVAEALEAERTALCREGAQHLVLSVRDPTGAWQGAFFGIGPDTAAARGVTGAYFAVEEAVLAEVDGVGRTYLAVEDRDLPDLGPGTVWLTPDGPADDPCADGLGVVRGRLSFPEAGLSGRFAAGPCPCNASSTVVLLSECLTCWCQRLPHGGMAGG